MDDEIRPYDASRDLDAVVRIWLEIGWIDSADKTKALGGFLGAANAEVATMNGEAECMVHWTPGSMRYQDTPLGLCAITAVTTSHIGRKRGFASRMTGRALAQGAAAGHAVAALGMFEQGFYDRLGFATGAYDHEITFDPAALLLDHIPYRTPERIPLDAWADLQGAMAGRLGSHGAVVLDPADLFAAEIGLNEKMYALGYRDEQGELTHFVLGSLQEGHGPFRITFLAYRTTDQLLELLRLLKEQSDQIRSVRMIEPAHVQLQALLREPIRHRWHSHGTDRESMIRSFAWYQLRMLDVSACVAARRWDGGEVRFNLTLTDPAAERLPGPWKGVGGDYTVTVGPSSSAVDGHAPGLATLRTSVGAFTRLWFGVRPATVLRVSDDLDAPVDLLTELDRAFALPHPILGWDF